MARKALLKSHHPPIQGHITFDGVDLRDLEPEWVHRNIGLVSQEPVLFATDIRSNICYGVGRDNVTDEEVEAAAKVRRRGAGARAWICCVGWRAMDVLCVGV